MAELRVVPVADTVQIDPSLIPAWVAENLAQAALPGIQRAWRDPEIRADYNRWRAEQARQEGKCHASL